MKKKVLLTTVAMLLVCAMSVAGTLAYLTATPNDGAGVTNTFVASGRGTLIETGGEIVLKEHVATKDDMGKYTLTTNETDNNSYEVLPGVDLPKDPFVRITKKTSAPAYLYVEVVDGITSNDAISFDMDECWLELEGVTGTNNGQIYVYGSKEKATAVTNASDLTAINIIKDKTIKVTAENDGAVNIAEEGIKLEFYAYLAQSTVTYTEDGNTTTSTDAATVFNICFPKN